MKTAAYLCAGPDAPADREGQLDAIERFRARPGWELAEVYADRSSGRRPDRTHLRRLLADAAQRKFEVVMIQRFDRAAGSLRELVHLFEALRRCGVALVFVEEQIDTATDGGDRVFQIMRAVGQFERRLHGQRIRVGLARARGLGTRIGRPPAGVDRATVVRLRSQGLSYRPVGRQLSISAALAHRLARSGTPDAPQAV